MSPRSALATQRRFLHTHRWRVGDLVMWGNRCTLHRGTEYDDLRWQRDMLRATVSDEINSCEREAVDLPREYQAKMCTGLASRQRDG
jgi:alpha-ketoglutarate-dependent 2,4-dichlorophenoxyacetate dioxygenase